jgi:hypothetical protein
MDPDVAASPLLHSFPARDVANNPVRHVVVRDEMVRGLETICRAVVRPAFDPSRRDDVKRQIAALLVSLMEVETVTWEKRGERDEDSRFFDTILSFYAAVRPEPASTRYLGAPYNPNLVDPRTGNLLCTPPRWGKNSCFCDSILAILFLATPRFLDGLLIPGRPLEIEPDLEIPNLPRGDQFRAVVNNYIERDVLKNPTDSLTMLTGAELARSMVLDLLGQLAKFIRSPPGRNVQSDRDNVHDLMQNLREYLEGDPHISLTRSEDDDYVRGQQDAGEFLGVLLEATRKVNRFVPGVYWAQSSRRMLERHALFGSIPIINAPEDESHFGELVDMHFYSTSTEKMVLVRCPEILMFLTRSTGLRDSKDIVFDDWYIHAPTLLGVAVFEIFAFLCHDGIVDDESVENASSSGHYTAFLRPERFDGAPRQWFYYNDELRDHACLRPTDDDVVKVQVRSSVDMVFANFVRWAD